MFRLRGRAGATQVVFVGAAVFYAIFIVNSRFEMQGETCFTLIDDAMISMGYARNLAAGWGLTWSHNLPPIEGYTTILWTLAMAGTHLLPLDECSISLAPMLLSAVALVLLLSCTRALYAELGGNKKATELLLVASLALYFPLVYWSLRGMETGWTVLIITYAALFAVRMRHAPGPSKPLALGVLASCAYLLRPDAVLAAAFLLAVGSFRQHRIHWRDLLLASLPLAATILVHLLLRYQYYGELWPNTYYLKLTGVSTGERYAVGLRVLVESIRRDLWPVLLFFGLSIPWLKNLRLSALLLLGVVVIQFGYSVHTGGDYAEGQIAGANRFILMGLPILFTIIALAWDQAADRLRASAVLAQRGTYALAVAAVLLAGGMMSYTPYAEYFRGNGVIYKADIFRARAGRALRELTTDDAVIAAHAAGNIPYFLGTERTVLDLLGKNDERIAKGPPAAPFRPGHNKWDYSYHIGEMKPDIIADRWGHLEAYLEENDPDSYLRIALPGGWFSYLRTDSAAIRWSQAPLLQGEPSQ